MTRRLGAVLLLVAMVLGSCSRLGLGEQTCEPQVRVPTPANVLAAQSVPTARYIPCFETIDPGWDSIEFEAESGRAGIAILEGTHTFLAAIVTESCEIGGAVPAPSGLPDVAKFEDIERVPSEIAVTILPVGAGQVEHSQALLTMWQRVEIEERPVTFVVNAAVDQPIEKRIGASLGSSPFIWIIDEVDVAEYTVELRSADGASFPRVTPAAALGHIEELAAKPVYRGNWYYTFDGGCITYIFNAENRLADKAPQVAEDSIGFYPAYQLWSRIGRTRAGAG